MRLLVTIPHYCRNEGEPQGPYRSEHGRVDQRADHVGRCIRSLHETFGPAQALADTQPYRCNEDLAATLVDVILVTTGTQHLVDRLPRALFGHAVTDVHPRLLGFFCHLLLRERIDGYDHFAYLEDDIEVTDPLFFTKLDWFERNFGPDALLQPNRFEANAELATAKMYIDGPPTVPEIPSRFQDITVHPRLEAGALGRTFRFQRVANAHAGGFFLSRAQLERVAAHPVFGRPNSDFFGPLESAATLPIMRSFNVYKPDRTNAGFLEVHHLGGRFLSPPA